MIYQSKAIVIMAPIALFFLFVGVIEVWEQHARYRLTRCLLIIDVNTTCSVIFESVDRIVTFPTISTIPPYRRICTHANRAPKSWR